MMTPTTAIKLALAAGLALAQGAWAALPPPSPAQKQAAAAKKAEADAKAAKEKELLAASMDRLSARWRAKAPGEGWKVNAPVAIAAAPAAAAPGAAPAGVTPAAAGIPAPAPSNAAPGGAAVAPATGAAPHSPQALNAANVPVKSEKLGTARPSEDVKKGPTRPVPAGTPPAIEKKGTPETANKK
ncbi:hypothetical protein [Massilia niastensis]|uniref:hypothetical protein n=1 Tax=Massilia niastensis TaxID=544911 RepID=UPI00036D9495|nr:hypothetical protein [Massilia niastensis]